MFISSRCVSVEVAVTASLNAVRDMYVKREAHMRIVCVFL